jgi:ABC-2 type transport system permease protein
MSQNPVSQEEQVGANSTSGIPEKTASLEGNVLPSSLAQVGIIAKYELRNYFRSRRFFILLAIVALITGALTAVLAYFGTAKIGGSAALSFYGFWWGFAPTFVVVFCSVFFGGDAIAGEFQNKTGYFLVGNPIRRSSIYIGKWIAAFTASLIIFAIYTAVTVANGLYYVGTNIPIQFGEAIGFTLLYLIAALGFTFLFSSLFKSGAYSIVVTFILLLFGFTLIDAIVTGFTSIEPWFSLIYAAQIISNVFTVPYPSHRTTFGGNTTFTPTIPEGLAIMAIYFVITSVLGLLLFERKEFN